MTRFHKRESILIFREQNNKSKKKTNWRVQHYLTIIIITRQILKKPVIEKYLQRLYAIGSIRKCERLFGITAISSVLRN